MTQKKKLSREEKKQRRLKEMQKAASRVDTRVTFKTAEVQENPQNNPERSGEKYNLPIKEIKSDLWKNLGFTVFAVALVVILKISGFGFQEVKHLLNL